jgi:tRNA(Arg) A34 adenosine deaminase TadA
LDHLTLADDDQRLLRRTFALARFARNQGNAPFGALCARPDGSVAAEGENSEGEAQGDLTCHAEMNAIRNASREWSAPSLTTLTLFASCEPCPMCAGAIALSGIKRVIFGASAQSAAHLGRSPNLVGCRQVFSLLGLPVEVVGPALEEEALQLLRL